MNYDLPGYGDSATWPSRPYHPSDPRAGDQDIARERAEVARYAELLAPGGACHPWDSEPFYVAVAALPDSEWERLIRIIRHSGDPEVAALRKAIVDYHEARAAKAAHEHVYGRRP